MHSVVVMKLSMQFVRTTMEEIFIGPCVSFRSCVIFAGNWMCIRRAMHNEIIMLIYANSRSVFAKSFSDIFKMFFIANYWPM